MATYEIEYTTNTVDRQTVTMEAKDKTQVYLKFVCEFPKHYIITNIKEGTKNDRD